MKEKPIRILFAEDNDSHAKLATRLFEELGLESSLERVTDGQELLDVLCRGGMFAGQPDAMQPDVIFLDLRLPKVDGLEALRIIKSSPALAQIPVVVLTTSASETDRASAENLQVSAYLVKPLDRARLTQVFADLGFVRHESSSGDTNQEKSGA